MKKRGRLLTLVLALCVVCTSLFGCGKEGNASSSEGKDGVVELTFWHNYGVVEMPAFTQMIEGFNNSQDKYHVNLVLQGHATEIRTKLMSTQQQYYPSLFCGQPMSTSDYATSDYVQPLQPYIDADEEDWTSGMFDVVRAAYSDLDGNMIGHPIGVSTNGIFINVTMLEKAGFSVDDITSYEKIAEASKAAVQKGLCKYALTYSNGIDFIDMLTMQGVPYVDNDNGYSGEATKSVLTEGETNEALKKLLQIYGSLYAEEVAYPFSASSTNDGKESFLAGNLLFWTTTNSRVHYMLEAELDFEWAFIPYVGVDDNAEFKGYAIAEGTGAYICNTGDEEEMQGAYELIKYMAKTENQVYWCKSLGYVPYTEEASKDADYVAWAQENWPSASKVSEMLLNAPKELRGPYVGISNDILNANQYLMGSLYTDPTGDLDSYIKDASERIDEAIEILNLRNQKGK